METERKCLEIGCRRACWSGFLFCLIHLFEHVRKSLYNPTRSTLSQRIDLILKTLSYREREIIKLRYGIGDGYKYTLEEVGRIFKVTRKVVRQIEAEAISKMQDIARTQKLEEFLSMYAFSEPGNNLIESVRICQAELLKYVARHPESLRRVSSRDFEKIIAEILSSFGFDVELTGKTRDGGYDILAFGMDNLGVKTKYIVECKRYAADNPIRVELVRGLYGVKERERADHALLVTTSYFTKDSVKFCQAPQIWNLHLKDYEAIKKWLKTYEFTAKNSVVRL